jgi:sugar phosphate isomerase/epimerase
MKIGCCLGPLAKDEAKTGVTIIPMIAELGFDYIELPLAQMMSATGAQRVEMARAVAAGGIPAMACNNFFPARVRLTGPEAKLDVALEYAKEACEWAASLGVGIIVLGSAGAKNLPAGFPYEAGRAQFSELLHGLESLAGPLGLTIVLEPLNSEESNFITSVGEGLALVQELNLAHIKLLADYFHMRKEDEDLTVITRTGKELRHVHIAAKQGRLLPREGDGEDYGRLFQVLKAVGYDAGISLEGGVSNDALVEASAALKLLRSFSISTQFRC